MDDRASKIAPKIAVVQGAPSAEVQELFRSSAGRWRPSSRLAGVLAEDHGLPDSACSAGYQKDTQSINVEIDNRPLCDLGKDRQDRFSS